MDDGQLASELLQIIAPNDAMIERMIAAGEHLPAIITLVEVAAGRNIALPTQLLDEVQALVDEDAFDTGDDRSSVVSDLAELRSASLVLP